MRYLLYRLSVILLITTWVGCNPPGKTIVEEQPAEQGAKYPECGSGIYNGKYLIAGPGETAYDADLAHKALQYERQFHLFNAGPMAVDASASVSSDDPGKRRMIEAFLRENDSWDFLAFSGGTEPVDVIDGWSKVAGLYGGMGICADAMRYAVLRDQGADCDEIAIARQHLIAGLEAAHMAFTIGGEPGVVARGFIRKDLPGDAEHTETVPLFDGDGNALPEVKDNGTWREDNSGLYPEYIWEDSCSRDMMLGWAAAVAIGLEVIRDDPSFEEALKIKLALDAAGVVEQLRVVRDSGYDLEFPDADGRITYHGYLNENSIERNLYQSGVENGFYALMTLGIVSAYAYASQDPEAYSYLYDELIAERELPRIARDSMLYINMDYASNFSNYSMAFSSAYLALRYIDDEQAREMLRDTTRYELYDTPGQLLQPAGAGMSLYDFITIYADLDGSAFAGPQGDVDKSALEDGIETLHGFVEPPYWIYRVDQCDEAELESGACVFEDGTETTVYHEGGRKGSTVCDDAIPKDIRRPSNYEWRSNPYEPNGGGEGDSLLSGVDFRIAYWTGRWTKLPQ
jgi:hypothetical protein